MVLGRKKELFTKDILIFSGMKLTKDKESYTMRIIKENVVDVLIDDNEELGWTIELHMNDESVITLEWLL